MLAESIWEQSVGHSHPAALGVADPQCHCLSQHRIHCLLPVVFARLRIIQVAIPIKSILGVQNAFSCTILITFGFMTYDSVESADI